MISILNDICINILYSYCILWIYTFNYYVFIYILYIVYYIFLLFVLLLLNIWTFIYDKLYILIIIF